VGRLERLGVGELGYAMNVGCAFLARGGGTLGS